MFGECITSAMKHFSLQNFVRRLFNEHKATAFFLD